MFRASLKGLYNISLRQALKNSGCKSQRKLEIECGYDLRGRKKDATISDDRTKNNDNGELDGAENQAEETTVDRRTSVNLDDLTGGYEKR